VRKRKAGGALYTGPGVLGVGAYEEFFGRLKAGSGGADRAAAGRESVRNPSGVVPPWWAGNSRRKQGHVATGHPASRKRAAVHLD
jgi:hypothetical protein